VLHLVGAQRALNIPVDVDAGIDICTRFNGLLGEVLDALIVETLDVEFSE